MSMYQNAGRFCRGSVPHSYSTTPSCSEEEEDPSYASCSNEEDAELSAVVTCTDEEETAIPPSTVVITRRKKDFGITTTYTRSQPLVPQPLNPARNLIPVSFTFVVIVYAIYCTFTVYDYCPLSDAKTVEHDGTQSWQIVPKDHVASVTGSEERVQSDAKQSFAGRDAYSDHVTTS